MAQNNIAKGWENPVKEVEPFDPTKSVDGSVTIGPEEPVQLVRDPITKKVVSVIYADMERMMQGDPVVMWTEDILRDPVTGKVIGIQTVRPNGIMTIEHIDRDVDGTFIGTRLEYL
jgi:hypothetical protein